MQLPSLKLAFFAFVWLFSQSAALQHELSSEHLNANYHHVCFAQATQLDDVITAPNQVAVACVKSEQIVSTQASVGILQTEAISPYLSRAPPQINLV